MFPHKIIQYMSLLFCFIIPTQYPIMSAYLGQTQPWAWITNALLSQFLCHVKGCYETFAYFLCTRVTFCATQCCVAKYWCGFARCKWQDVQHKRELDSGLNISHSCQNMKKGMGTAKMFGYYIMLLMCVPVVVSYYLIFHMYTMWEINMIGLLCSKWVWRLGKDCKNGSDCLICHCGWPQLRGWQYNKEHSFTWLYLYSITKPHGVMKYYSIGSMCSITESIYDRTDTTKHFTSLWPAYNPGSQSGRFTFHYCCNLL